MTTRGRFITLEGIEGVGKSTQARLLADWLEAEGASVVRTREPGGTLVAEAIRALLKDASGDGMDAETELLLIFAARREHVERLVRPALQTGHWVVSDRFVDASFAYQGAGRELGVKRVAQLADWLVPGLEPDLSLWLDLPLETALERLTLRGARDRFEREDEAFFRRVSDGYEARAEQYPRRIHRVDAAGAPEDVQRRCRAIVAPLLERAGS